MIEEFKADIHIDSHINTAHMLNIQFLSTFPCVLESVHTPLMHTNITHVHAKYSFQASAR